MASTATDHHRSGAGVGARAGRRSPSRTTAPRPAANAAARLLGAADAERRRIARDLHDGLQLRLVLLAIRADELCLDERACPEARAHGDRIQAELQAAIAELRAFVDGVMPAALCERGLVAAIQELIDAVPIPVGLTLTGVDEPPGPRPARPTPRLPEPVESVAYFVVCEALSNAVKHAGADAVAVALTLGDGRLRISVSDDGSGGADAHGSGICGVADRVEALGGRLTIDSPAEYGTRVVAQLPCRPAPISDRPAPATDWPAADAAPDRPAPDPKPPRHRRSQRCK